MNLTFPLKSTKNNQKKNNYGNFPLFFGGGIYLFLKDPPPFFLQSFVETIIFEFRGKVSFHGQ